MRVLIAVKPKRGQKLEDDFFFTKVGELVKPCACGCGRALVGMKTSRATTTFTVAEMPISVHQYADILKASYTREGWQALVQKSDAKFMDEARELNDIASGFPKGALLQINGDKITLRVAR